MPSDPFKRVLRAFTARRGKPLSIDLKGIKAILRAKPPPQFSFKKTTLPDEVFGQGFRLFSAYDERRRGTHRISLKMNSQIQHPKNKNAPYVI